MQRNKKCDSSNRPVTVAHLMPWNGMGGVEIATLRMVDATRERFRNVVFCLPDAVALRDAFEKAGIETVEYRLPEPSLRHGKSFYKQSRVLARQLRDVGSQIVHFADQKAAYHNSVAAFLARCKTLCHLRTCYPCLSFRDRITLRLVQKFIFVSKAAKDSFAMSLPERNVRVIYDAVDAPPTPTPEESAAVRRELGIPSECTVIGMVARIAPVKDYFTLASAASEVLRSYPDTYFLLVGDNSLVELNRCHYREVVQHLKNLGIADKFIFTGHREDVPRLTSAMDVCVLCTHREGFPLTIVEAMAMQKPVVATAVGGIPEIIKSGVTGYLHQHGNSKELAAAIVSLIADTAAARKIGLAACECVCRDYSRERFVEEISRAYSDAMYL